MQRVASKSDEAPKPNACSRFTTLLQTPFRAVYNAAPSVFTDPHPGIPKLPGIPLVGRFYQFAFDLFGEMKRAGKVAGNHKSRMCYEWVGPKQVFYILGTDAIKQIMKLDDQRFTRVTLLRNLTYLCGEFNLFSHPAETKEQKQEWKKQKNEYINAFGTREAAIDSQEIAEIIYKHLKNAEGTEVELKAFFGQLIIDIFSQKKMGAKYSPKQLAETQQTMAGAVEKIGEFTTIAKGLAQHELKARGINIKGNVIGDFKAMTHKKLITDFFGADKAKFLQTPTFFQRLVNTIYEKDGKALNEENLVSDDVPLSTGVFLTIVGHLTTSRLVQYTLMELLKNPDILLKLKKEFDEFGPIEFDEKGPIISAKDLNTFKYLDQVIKESLRLNPPAPLLPREVTEDFTLTLKDGTTVNFKKGTIINISPYLTQRLPEVAGDKPDEFIPERWEDNPHIFTFPFGNGRRACPAEKYATLEAKMAIFLIVKNFDVKLKMKGLNLDEKYVRIFLNPKYPVQAEFHSKVRKTV